MNEPGLVVEDLSVALAAWPERPLAVVVEGLADTLDPRLPDS